MSLKQFPTIQLTNLQLMKAIIIINGESYLAILHTSDVIPAVAPLRNIDESLNLSFEHLQNYKMSPNQISGMSNVHKCLPSNQDISTNKNISFKHLHLVYFLQLFTRNVHNFQRYLRKPGSPGSRLFSCLL